MAFDWSQLGRGFHVSRRDIRNLELARQGRPLIQGPCPLCGHNHRMGNRCDAAELEAIERRHHRADLWTGVDKTTRPHEDLMAAT